MLIENKYKKRLREDWRLFKHQCKLLGKDIANMPLGDFLKFCLMMGFVFGSLSYLRHLRKYHI